MQWQVGKEQVVPTHAFKQKKAKKPLRLIHSLELGHGWTAEVVIEVLKACRHILKIDFFFILWSALLLAGMDGIRDEQEPEVIFLFFF